MVVELDFGKEARSVCFDLFSFYLWEGVFSLISECIDGNRQRLKCVNCVVAEFSIHTEQKPLPLSTECTSAAV